MKDVLYPRAAAPLQRLSADPTFLAHVEAGATAADITLSNYDSATKKTTRTAATSWTLSNDWCASVTAPNLAREQAWLVHVLSFKQDTTSVAAAAAEHCPDDVLARLRHDLSSRAAPHTFDARAWWCAVASLLSPDELVAFVGDARVFAHSHREGGTSIVTGYGDRVRFYEAFFQVVAPYLTTSQWRDIVTILEGFGSWAAQVAAAAADLDRLTLTSARLRLAAASGLRDDVLIELLPAIAAAQLDVFDVLFSLRDPVHLQTHAAKYIKLMGEQILLQWLDRFGVDAPALIVDSINAAPTRKVADPLVGLLIRELDGDPALPPILAAVVGSKAGARAEKWLAAQAKKSTKKAAKKPQRSS